MDTIAIVAICLPHFRNHYKVKTKDFGGIMIGKYRTAYANPNTANVTHAVSPLASKYPKFPRVH